MKKICLLCVLATAFILGSCTSGVKASIDNPTDGQITVSIDGDKEYTLQAGELLDIKGLKEGDHTMTVNGGEEIPFTVSSANVLINPTLSTYVVAREEYGIGFVNSSDWVDVELDGKEYHGPFVVHEATPVIDHAGINYNTITPFPEEVTISSGASTVVRHKIFRKNDFFPYFKEEYR